MRLCRIAGTTVSVHPTTLLLLAFIGWEGWQDGGLWEGALWSVAFAILTFTCILLHEFGHITAAKAFGIHSPRVVLMPIGGMAEFTEIPRDSRQEVIIALAGPAVNAAIILVLWAWVPFPHVAWKPYPHFTQLGLLETTAAGMAAQMIMVNMIMGLFNLIPSFPMDGGRVLRALLSRRLPYLRATFLAALLAKMIGATAIACWFFFPLPPLLPVLVVFILWAGEMEYRTVRRREQWLQEYEAAASFKSASETLGNETPAERQTPEESSGEPRRDEPQAM